MAQSQVLSTQSIATESIENGLDRRHLREIQRRFLALNEARLQRTLDSLEYRQQQFLRLLPLLLHENHPLLPGYCGQATPAGIAEYSPTADELKNAKTLARSFRYRHQAYRARAIEALFVMGSLGTVAQTRSSDLDFWLCYSNDLNDGDISQLQLKCDNLSAAAKSLRLECHFFLMNAKRFREGERQALSNEASGSTQHLLLLDEFYRTALWLAGRQPLWWLVPPIREQHYADYRHQLITNRFIAGHKFIDFGPVAAIPTEEFASAALWQLYKAIESPYKSLFKLLLLEAYTGKFPGFQPLCLNVKQQLYNGEVDVDELDPYVVAYRRIEYLLHHRQESERLEIVRHCLYFKVNQALSKNAHKGGSTWQRQLMQKLSKEWAWDNNKIVDLDCRRNWKAARVMQERKAVVRELLNCYQRLQAFTRQHHAQTHIDRQEFNTLGHKLYANYEQRPGKIEWINPGISDDLGEAYLCFVENKIDADTIPSYQHPQWRVYPSSKEDLAANVNWRISCPMPLKSGSLMEVVLWCYCNGLLQRGTRCEFDFSDEGIHSIDTTAQIYPLIRALQQWLPLPLASVSHKQFQHRPQITHLFIHVNLGREPDKALYNKGMVHISDIDDALGYGELKTNLVKSIDLVSRNSWNEIECHHYENDGANMLYSNALALALRTCLQLCIHPTHRGQSLPDIRVHCGSSNSGNTIRHRVETILLDMLRCYASPKQSLSTRYLLSMQQGFFACQCQAVSDDRTQARFEFLSNEEEVHEYLARAQQHYSPLYCDRYLVINDAVRLIAKVSRERGIHLVCHTQGTQAELIVLDEKGSLFRGHVPYYNDTCLLRSLHHFLRQVIARQTRRGSDFSAQFDVFPIHFYKLLYRNQESRTQQQAYLEPCHSSTNLDQLQCYPIQIKASCDLLGNENLELHCNRQIFSQTQLGRDFFPTVREYIIGLRPSAQRYPCYITDLDLSDYHLPGLNPEQWQTSHYLRFKVDLEARLNSFGRISHRLSGPR